MVNRVPIVLARINQDISLAQFESSVRNLVLDIENTYWDLAPFLPQPGNGQDRP